jgi:hypothetical protein
MEEALQSIVLAGLQRVNTEINFCQKWQIFDILQLIDFLDIVQIQVQEFQT